MARQWYTLPVRERWVNPLPDEASRAKWEKFNVVFPPLFDAKRFVVVFVPLFDANRLVPGF